MTQMNQLRATGEMMRTTIGRAAWRARYGTRSGRHDVVAELATLEDAERGDLVLRRAWLQSGGLVLEYVDGERRAIPAVWAPGTVSRTRAINRLRRAGLEPPSVRRTPFGPVLVHPHGRDPALPGLAPVLERRRGRILRHRLARRALLSARAPSGERCFAKVFHGAGPVRRMRAVEQLVGRAGEELRVPRIVDADEHLHVVFSAVAEGESLRRLLREDRAASALDRFARATRVLHGLAPGPETQAYAPTTEARRIWRRVEAAASLWPEHGEGLEAAARRARERLAALEAPAGAVVHRDLHAANALIDDRGEVTLLDLDDLAAGDPALDLGGVAASLIRDALVEGGGLETGLDAAGRFLDAYRADRRLRERSQSYCDAKLIAIAAGCAFRPGGRERAAELAELAVAPPRFPG